MRKSAVCLRLFGWHYHSPLTKIPDEYVYRIGGEIRLTPLKDPKNRWGQHNLDIQAAHSNFFGAHDNQNLGFQDGWMNALFDFPPVPVYRQNIHCQGAHHRANMKFHPKLWIKIPPGKTVPCKYCGLRYINMSTHEDNDDHWREECDEIAQIPETMAELERPFRQVTGQWGRDMRNFQDGKDPHPHVYRTVYDPQKHYYSKYFPNMKVSQKKSSAH